MCTASIVYAAILSTLDPVGDTIGIRPSREIIPENIEKCVKISGMLTKRRKKDSHAQAEGYTVIAAHIPPGRKFAVIIPSKKKEKSTIPSKTFSPGLESTANISPKEILPGRKFTVVIPPKEQNQGEEASKPVQFSATTKSTTFIPSQDQEKPEIKIEGIQSVLKDGLVTYQDECHNALGLAFILGSRV